MASSKEEVQVDCFFLQQHNVLLKVCNTPKQHEKTSHKQQQQNLCCLV
jgi:hypothetical protein